MSRAGRRARRERLIRSGQWTPTTALQSMSAKPKLKPEDERARALIADRDGWIAAVGITGWRREQDRRQALRLARARERRARVTSAELGRLMRQVPCPARPSECDDGDAVPPCVSLADRLGEAEMAALARLRVQFG